MFHIPFKFEAVLKVPTSAVQYTELPDPDTLCAKYGNHRQGHKEVVSPELLADENDTTIGRDNMPTPLSLSDVCMIVLTLYIIEFY